MLKAIERHLDIPEQYAGMRLDHALAKLLTEYSRGCIQGWIKQGMVTVNGTIPKVRDKLKGGEQISICAELEVTDSRIEAENLPVDVVFEDEHLLVINKKAGMVVHPASGNHQGTLQNALLYHWPQLAVVPRAGIVHRLDKMTSGIMMVAKTLEAHKQLVEQLSERKIKRQYIAIVHGVMVAGGTVDAPIGRHPVDRKKMAVVNNGKPAVTHYRVEEKFRSHTLLQVQLETGRTHQIRVHMAHIHYPILGDPVYGGRPRVPSGASESLLTLLKNFNRQALHAMSLQLAHPVSGEILRWEIPWPDDISEISAALRKDHQLHGSESN